MAKWEDIQVEVLRQEIAELEKSSNEAQGNEQEIQKRRIVDLQQQLATAEKASSTRISNTDFRGKAKGKQGLDQLKQRFSGKTRQSDSERSQRGMQSEEIDEHGRLLRLAEDFLACKMLYDNEGARRVLGFDVLDAKHRSIGKALNSYNAEHPSDARLPRSLRRKIKTMNEALECADLTTYTYRLHEKVMRTIVTTPRAKLPVLTPGDRFRAAISIPILVLITRWQIFKIWRSKRKLSALKRRVEFRLQRYDETR
ncbi:MAG: hypothetical protein Q9165_001592 [Trypethelium subeluteriae]